MDVQKRDRAVSQTITIICATCGKPSKVSNREEKTPFMLYGNELYFECPNCESTYDVPMRKEC